MVFLSSSEHQGKEDQGWGRGEGGFLHRKEGGKFSEEEEEDGGAAHKGQEGACAEGAGVKRGRKTNEHKQLFWIVLGTGGSNLFVCCLSLVEKILGNRQDSPGTIPGQSRENYVS